MQGQAEDDIQNARDTTETHLLGGRVSLRQPAKGYRAGMDAALLAATVAPKAGERIIEAGCGAGAVLMQIALRHPQVSVTGLERDPFAYELAVHNAQANDVVDRAHIIHGDVANRFKALDLPTFDWAVSNPPYFDDPNTIRAPAEERRGAWIADHGLKAWTEFLVKSVREGGKIVIVHRADRLADILSLLAPKAGSFAIRPVHSFADEPAKRVLVQATKTGKAPLRLLPPLVLHPRTGPKHTPEAEAILRGEADLTF
ncbi:MULTISPECIES: tRNA1(Val) (adenine(37)-N6)-methyltransferase [unclassified Brevundimonas]|uniref:tRNA1(Val) (adenine(37)-N6)-methyltransferase n=1 Tax=unclassified Brevundimonas TaxID=2622653 RepID=UPI0025C01545|nr:MULTISPECIES: methyltransferase [unclassified Brevundimonas]